MIIQSLSAENLLKYSRLELQDLPQDGVIAVSGDNESGKSTIGECICFALFGRSFAVDEDELEKLIHWGESSCSVQMRFRTGAGENYHVARFLDRDGNHSARLCKGDDEDNPVARGVDAVADALHGILGYEFEEFIESFYLAQREITTPHPHSYAVKIMAGIAPLEICHTEFEDELEREQVAVESARTKVADAEAQTAALGFDEKVLQALESRRRDLVKLRVGVKERGDDLIAAAGEYQEREPRLRAAESSRGTAAGFRLLFVLLALVALGLWALLAHAPESQVGQQVAGLLSENVPGWGPEYLTWVLYGGIGCAVLFVLFWIRAGALGTRIAELRDTGGRLDQELSSLDGLEQELAQADLAGAADGEAADAAPVLRVDQEARGHLLRRVQDGSAAAEEVRVAVEREGAWLERSLGRVEQGLASLDAEIGAERQQQEEHQKLSGMHEALQQQLEEHQHRIQLREMALQLLTGASRQLSHHFNHNLRGLVGKTLPLFTEGRYEHLQIDEDLSVRVFSNEKRDFMDLDEISSGTQRQIMLALRLALSQELINRVAGGKQFVFLDEPFAFFDDTRTRSSLAVLPTLSDDLTQIWIVAQQFPADVAFDRHIVCDRSGDSYVGQGAE